MRYDYKTENTCAQMISFDIEDDVIRNIEFYGGCNGNLKGISALLVGMTTQEAVRRMEGICCGPRTTSCPDQLAQALKQG